MRVKPLGPLRADTIFDDLSRKSDKDGATLEKKRRDMDHSTVSNNIVNLIVASNAL